MTTADSTENIGTALAKGSAWMLGLRWAVRLIGLVNTYILVRLLNPTDFGIVAMAMIVVGLIEALADSGQKLLVIKHQSPQREDFDTAWTMSILIGLAVTVVILLLSPFTQIYFHEPRAVGAMQWLALRSLLSGFENTGVLNFRRDLRFDRYFAYLVASKLVSVPMTITAAIIFRDYRALLIGIVGAQAVTVAMSFIVSPYRPRLSLARLGEMWHFSIWSSIRSLGLSLNDQVDQLAVGGASGASAMGRYAVASDVGSLFTVEVLGPIIAVLFPVMASVQSDAAKMRSVYLNVFQWSAVICISTSVGVAICGNDIVDVLLGAKWIGAKPLIPFLALSAGILSMSSSVYSALDVTGRAKISAQLQWTRLICLSVAVFLVGFATRNPTHVAAARFVVTLALAPALFLIVARTVDFPVRTLLLSIWRPALAAVAMAAIVWTINLRLGGTGAIRLFVDAASGALAFCLVSLVLWRASGCPNTPERFVWNSIAAKFCPA
ncbi:MAG TPA: oligosaccharide flippase family protein [Rhizomicrobium sp.]|jgi:O-antigen/teichoic acid export membrane protein